MNTLFIVFYGLTIIYFSSTERVQNFVRLLMVQGVLLFAIEFFSIIKINIIDFIFILTETLVVKAIVIPRFMNKVRKENSLKGIHEPFVPVIFSIIAAIIIIVISFLLSNQLASNPDITGQFFTVAFASVIFGIYFIIIHKNIFSHVVGYLIIENGIFLLSLAIGSHIPMLVNLAVLFDLFLAVLIFGIFINRVGNTFNSVEINQLSNLKD